MQRETFAGKENNVIVIYMMRDEINNSSARLSQPDKNKRINLALTRIKRKMLIDRLDPSLDYVKKEISQIISFQLSNQITPKQIRQRWSDRLDPSLNHDSVYFVRDLDEIKKFSQIKNEREFSTNLISSHNLLKKNLSDEVGQINEREFSLIRWETQYFYPSRNVEVERTPKRTRALLDENNVLILRPNEKFLTWEIPSAKNLDQQQRNLNAFQLFRLHYFKTLFNNSKHHSIKASKLSKINDEVNEAWNDSEIIRENYQLLRQNVNDSFVNQLFNGSNF
ncbi:unnamed protein product [Rhizophagus irregularis]|uniref:Uncharacterized protein n=1 Tax=Rhizophagus irregularis TaxID=588596 RepID=A0A2N1P107_9GLOM|nr:hypothetical protein RhiirC2_860268 [Rhizophagus irregularis]CAB4386052.1 unnamed protein product [Rhizophagus irregularis]CAB5374090.1 unnamed protein product [Rhizophagus irregularis]